MVCCVCVGLRSVDHRPEMSGDRTVILTVLYLSGSSAGRESVPGPCPFLVRAAAVFVERGPRLQSATSFVGFGWSRERSWSVPQLLSSTSATSFVFSGSLDSVPGSSPAAFQSPAVTYSRSSLCVCTCVTSDVFWTVSDFCCALFGTVLYLDPVWVIIGQIRVQQ